MRKTSACLSALALTVAAVWALPAYADERSDLVEKQKEQTQKIENLSSSLEGVDVSLQKAYLQLQQTQGKIPAAQDALAKAEDALSAANREAEANAALLAAARGELAQIGEAITDAQAKAAASRDNLGELARATYRGELQPNALSLIVGATSSKDFLDAYLVSSAISRTQSSSLTQFQQAAAQSENQKARQNAVEAQVTDLKAKADAIVVKREESRAAAQAKQDELTKLEDDLKSQTAALEDRKSEFKKSIQTVTVARDETSAEIAKIDAENRRKAAEAARRAAAAKRSQAAGSASGGGSTESKNTGSGYWLHPPVPAPVYVTSPWGMRIYPFDGSRWMHNGVDLRSSCGEPQRAPADGTVARTVPAPGNSTHGNQIFINHGIVNGSSWVTVTNHLSGFNVRPGQSVKQGEVIGWTGQTGMVTGCHVHFEIWKDGRVINPMSLPSFTQRFG
ncbi:murein DD-endopeptidase MepM/ murein hydrolase activator NlpD [Arcanobacterium wilhelmae]|uniref:Murein DD-endopeptidase MepM/ murein hydrolase activator NlpD n=1 Tax=Arcanobacterium wilhelmae TaxID=1803177 RepID=A0ABT9NE86_9ACTO|nr:peptidoglycan DD-metalloendopeptidase family protein [Arcanobacterium wilhelmae]MDP9801501.1 murein DD-endopeptidase MepM/ murein hydrolase activator NlpD [Arcanobacterium wilhelmae]WFN90832.1 peptidoglycan DD-metalloendopeptidase family protein [Arcanobacterium wilhelmae]